MIKALHAVETQFQAGEAAALALPPLEVEQELLGIAAEQPQLVELGIVACGDHAAVAQVVRRRVDDGPGQQGVVVAVLVVVAAELGDELLEQGGAAGGGGGERVRCQLGQHARAPRAAA